MKKNSEYITEGYMPFMGYNTYYRIVGQPSSKVPLLLLHGGPGSTHNYFEVLDGIADTGRQVIMYDQIGCGKSYIERDDEAWNRKMWTKETWIAELMALRQYLHLDKVHLLGQSWGGMQIIAYLTDERPDGIVSAIISSGHCSSKVWAEDQHELIRQLSQADQAAIAHAEETEDWEDEAYLQANEHYYERFVISIDENSPECLKRPKKAGKASYVYGWGPNEYVPTGNLSDFEYTDRLSEINVPTLIISGEYDICTPRMARMMNEGISGSRWELFKDARHTCFVDQNEKYCQLLTDWLESM